MRFLTVGNMYPPHRLGGYEVIWQDWVEHARSRGHTVEVLTSDFRLDGQAMGPEQGVSRVLRWYWRDHEFPPVSLREARKIESQNSAHLSSRLREFSPDAVVWWGMAGMSTSMVELVRRAGLPSVPVLGDYWLEYAQDVDGWMRKVGSVPCLSRVVERATGQIAKVDLGSGLTPVFVSKTVRDSVARRMPQYQESLVLHHGPDLALFRPEPRRRWDWSLLYAGRIGREKGIDIAVSALPELPDEATLRVIGSGDRKYQSELGDLAHSLGIEERVEFLEQTPREDLAREFARADALVFPVLWKEPWGLVPSEAMASGLPVVATGRGGSGEYLRDAENCLIFDPDDGPAGLAICLRRLESDGALRERLRAAGLETAQDLGAFDFSQGVLSVVMQAVDSVRDPSGSRG